MVVQLSGNWENPVLGRNLSYLKFFNPAQEVRMLSGCFGGKCSKIILLMKAQFGSLECCTSRHQSWVSISIISHPEIRVSVSETSAVAPIPMLGTAVGSCCGVSASTECLVQDYSAVREVQSGPAS